MAFVKIQNDFATAVENCTALGLVLLDLSAAFDTIDHFILFGCLQHWYGIDGLCLSGYSHTSTQGNKELK